MHIPFIKDLRVDFEAGCMRLEVFKRYSGRFLHHVTQVTGEGEAAFSFTQAHFHEQDLSASGCPRQASGYSRNAGEVGI